MQIELRVSGSKHWVLNILLPLLWPTLSFLLVVIYTYIYPPNKKLAINHVWNIHATGIKNIHGFVPPSLCIPFSSLSYQGWFLSGRHQSTMWLPWSGRATFVLWGLPGQDRKANCPWISIPFARDLGWASEVDKVFDNINAVFSQNIVCSSANCLGGGTKSNFQCLHKFSISWAPWFSIHQTSKKTWFGMVILEPGSEKHESMSFDPILSSVSGILQMGSSCYQFMCFLGMKLTRGLVLQGQIFFFWYRYS